MSDTPKIEVKMTFTPDPDFYSDVLITAFDGQYGGCWYWAEPDRERLSTEGEWLTVEGSGIDGTWMAAYVIEVEDLAGQGRPRLVVDHAAIARGIERIVSGEVKVGEHITRYINRALREDNAGDIDSDAADCIVQAAVFGQVVYG